MTSNLLQKLQELKQLLDSGLLTVAEFERERETLLAAWHAAPALSATVASVDLDALPTVIALPLGEYLDEVNPVLKLWYACDGVEMLLRLVVMMGLAMLSQRGPLTPELRKRLREYRLEEPTLGNWRAMAEAVVEAVGEAPGPLPELPDLVRATLVPLLLGPGEGERDESNSFIRLRNRLAHGGGISRTLAQSLIEVWQPRLRALWEQLAWLAQVELVAQDSQGGYGILRGPNPQAQPYTPRDPAALAQAFAAGDAVVLARGEALLPLWPLALYGPPRSPNPDAPPADEIVPQVYLRRGEVRLQYTPLGALAVGLSESEEPALERFLDWFKVADEPRARRGQFQVRDFADEMRKDGLRLIGREQECETLKTAVAGRTEGVIWVSGVAGIGKSYLFAWLALRLLDEPPPDTLVLPYRFRAGDERCGREAFLRFAVERLAAWLEIEIEADSTPWLKRLHGLLEQLVERRVVFLLDGLDEIAVRDRGFAQSVPLALTGPGVLWVCAGRPDYDLSAIFAAAGAFQPFPSPDGLPGMNEGDIRTLLLERIGPLRKHLLRHDQEQGERIGNPFVEKVARAAADVPLYVKEKVAEAKKGVPLYVKYVIDDIFAGRYRVLDGHERLPPSLSAYYEELLRRLSVGDLYQVLTPLAATLAVALEPLDAPALAALLRRRGKLVPEGAEGLRLVERGLSAIASMLKRAPTPAGRDGYTLYHLSLRQHMATSEHSQAAVATAREVLGDLALDVAPDAAAPYLYRCGIAHLLETHRAAKALGQLTRFEYLMDRLRTLTDSEAVEGLGEDWRATVRHTGPLDNEQRLWEAFWREREHILRRGDDRWPTYKILLQLAVEHADDSPVTRQAEAWLAAGQCDWVWLRNPQRIKHAVPNPCLRVFEGHTDAVLGAIELKDGRILSWSADKTLRLWDRTSGTEQAVLKGHTWWVEGAIELACGEFLSWSSSENALRLWNAESNAQLAALIGHTSCVHGVIRLTSGQILSWSLDGTLRLWREKDRNELAIMINSDSVGGAIEITDGSVLSWSRNELRIWNGTTWAELFELKGHSDDVHGAIEVTGRRILSWGGTELRLWSQTNGCNSIILHGHTARVEGAIELQNCQILSWSLDCTLRLWDGESGVELKVLTGHAHDVCGAKELSNGDILSWSKDGTLRLWDTETGFERVVLKGHKGLVSGGLELSSERILSWSIDGTIRIWNKSNGALLTVLSDHTWEIEGVIILMDGGILSWSGDTTLRLWDLMKDLDRDELVRHTRYVEEGRETILRELGGIRITVMELSDRRLLSWTNRDETLLRMWDETSGAPLGILNEHTGCVDGVVKLSHERIMSYGGKILQIWDEASGDLLNNITININEIVDPFVIKMKMVLISNKRILSWYSRLAASPSDYFEEWLWLCDIEKGSEIAVLKEHNKPVCGAIGLADERILSWSEDHTLRVWDEKNGKQMKVLSGHTDKVLNAIELSSGRILSWAWDDTLRLWEGASGAELAVLTGHAESAVGALELGDGRILSWSWDDTLRLWDLISGAVPIVLAGHTKVVTGAAIIANVWILSWSQDNALRLWDAHSGKEKRKIQQADAPWLAPGWLAAQQEVINPQVVRGRFVGWNIGKMSGIANRTRLSSETPVWQGDARVDAQTLLPDGTLVVTLDSGHVFCLKLHHGARRITLAEWDELLAKTDRAPCETPLDANHAP